MDMSLNKLQEIVKNREAWQPAAHESQTVGHDWVTEQQKTQNSNLKFMKVLKIHSQNILWMWHLAEVKEKCKSSKIL